MSLIKIFQFVVAILLVLVILLQNKGGGLSGVFGGSGNVYMAKRGVDKVLFTSTIVLSVFFFLISILNFML